jgi:hypothetical protein
MMGKIKEIGILSQGTYNREISCRPVALFSVNPTFPFSYKSWTSARGTIVFVDQKFSVKGRIRPKSCGGQKGARKP